MFSLTSSNMPMFDSDWKADAQSRRSQLILTNIESKLRVEDCWASCGRVIQWVHRITPPTVIVDSLLIESITLPRPLSLQYIHDFIVRAIDSGHEVCALVLLDLSLALDTVHHDTLLCELTHRFEALRPSRDGVHSDSSDVRWTVLLVCRPSCMEFFTGAYTRHS